LIIAALIAVAGWNYYQDRGISPSAATSDTPATSRSVKPAQTFTCDGRQHCSQMRSRAEAEYFNRYCPNTKMDGDREKGVRVKLIIPPCSLVRYIDAKDA
jgi:hypothetical protein